MNFGARKDYLEAELKAFPHKSLQDKKMIIPIRILSLAVPMEVTDPFSHQGQGGLALGGSVEIECIAAR